MSNLIRYRSFGFATRLVPVVGILMALLVPAHAGDAELIMFERDGCEYCDAWNESIGVAYPRTWEGRTAPLRRVNLSNGIDEDLKSIRRPRYSPTFVLMLDNQEVGRIRGHPGDEFFWPMLGELLGKAGFSDPDGD